MEVMGLRYYLVDLENVPNSILHVEKSSLTRSSNLVVFYSERVRSHVDLARANLERCFRSVRYVYIVPNVKNALDFNLVCYVGILVGSFRGRSLEIYVVSNDTGYLAISDYLYSLVTKFKLQYGRVSGRNICPVSEKPIIKNKQGNPVKLSTILTGDYPREAKIRLLRKAIKEDDVVSFICDNLKTCKGSKQKLSELLQKRYGLSGNSYYNMLSMSKFYNSEIQGVSDYD